MNKQEIDTTDTSTRSIRTKLQKCNMKGHENAIYIAHLVNNYGNIINSCVVKKDRCIIHIKTNAKIMLLNQTTKFINTFIYIYIYIYMKREKNQRPKYY